MATDVDSSLESEIRDLTRRARVASRGVANLDSATKNSLLLQLAEVLNSSQTSAELMAANAQDLEAARQKGVSTAMLDRLALDARRIGAIVDGLQEVAALPDPVGIVRRSWKRPNGLKVGKKTIPLGVIGIIYEARPNVTIDAFSLCFKAGNSTVLKGGSEASHSNRSLVRTIHQVLAPPGMEEACQLLDSSDRQAMAALLRQEENVDLIIPRGGEGLIRFVAENSRIPVIKHYKGVCHVYVDEDADPSMALSIAENAKISRPATCNAMETLLVHEGIADTFLPVFSERMQKAGVEMRGGEKTRKILPGAAPASQEDYHTEYLDLVLNIRVVSSLQEAIEHIEEYGSSHTEAIVTNNDFTAQEFLDRVDSSVVLANASTRFSDGGQLGLGAEIGISTTKLHAYGPMGLDSLVTEKFVIHGEGQIRE